MRLTRHKTYLHAEEELGVGFSEILQISRIWLNGEPVEGNSPITDGDEVAVLPRLGRLMRNFAQVLSPIRKKPSVLVPSVSGYSCSVVRAIDKLVGVRSGY